MTVNFTEIIVSSLELVDAAQRIAIALADKRAPAPARIRH
jgi:hypothetical protein